MSSAGGALSDFFFFFPLFSRLRAGLATVQSRQYAECEKRQQQQIVFGRSCVCVFFVSHLRPMGFNVLSYQSHLLQRYHPVTVNACGHEGSFHLFPVIALHFLSRHTFSTLSPPPVLSACPLHTNSGCGKERRILIGPW